MLSLPMSTRYVLWGWEEGLVGAELIYLCWLFFYTHTRICIKKGGTVCSVEVQSGSAHFSTADSVISTHAHTHTGEP